MGNWQGWPRLPHTQCRPPPRRALCGARRPSWRQGRRPKAQGPDRHRCGQKQRTTAPFGESECPLCSPVPSPDACPWGLLTFITGHPSPGAKEMGRGCLGRHNEHWVLHMVKSQAVLGAPNVWWKASLIVGRPTAEYKTGMLGGIGLFCKSCFPLFPCLSSFWSYATVPVNEIQWCASVWCGD